MDFKCIEMQQKSDAIAVVTLNRPERRNVLNIAMMEELGGAIERLEHTSCRVVVFAANGPAFSGGLDLKEAADPNLNETTAEHVAKLLTTVAESPLVTIAAVQGDAYAGGAGLVAACDLAVMAKGAVIGFPEVRRGLVAALVSAVLTRQISGCHMRQLLLTGEAVDGARAQAMGLVSHVTDADVMVEAFVLAEQVVKGGPEAIRLTKRVIKDLAPRDFLSDIQHALAVHHTVRQSAEAREGIAAFLEKRPTSW